MDNVTKERVMKEPVMAAAFNEWMRRYTEDPKAFKAEFQSVGQFLTEQSAGKVPCYGTVCTVYLHKLAEELIMATEPALPPTLPAV